MAGVNVVCDKEEVWEKKEAVYRAVIESLKKEVISDKAIFSQKLNELKNSSVDNERRISNLESVTTKQVCYMKKQKAHIKSLEEEKLLLTKELQKIKSKNPTEKTATTGTSKELAEARKLIKELVEEKETLSQELEKTQKLLIDQSSKTKQLCSLRRKKDK